MSNDLSREVYCVLGMPVDAGGMQPLLRDIAAAAGGRSPLLISLPNLNSLINLQSDSNFKQSFLHSDLCPPDGMPIVWIARLFGVPIKDRVAGSDMFDALKTYHKCTAPLKVFFFGAPEGAAAAACRALNAQPSGLYCVGSHYPGFGSVDEMSGDEVIDKINSSNADFLVVSLGAKKGQSWLLRNQHRLLIPVRAHLGAVINFQAGSVKRAPRIMRKLGLEWLWRIKEEPYLWRRYWNDGTVLLCLLLTRVLPLVIRMRRLQRKYSRPEHDLLIRETHSHECVTLSLSGSASAKHVKKVIPVLRDAIAMRKRIVIDFSDTRFIDARFLGLLLMVRKKQLNDCDSGLSLIGLSRELESIFAFNGLGFLLSPHLSG
jgi:N-acetylglucosaminyldiphosphoundecaprenol N-acetyl-beta-D-mannosaminyltransferase